MPWTVFLTNIQWHCIYSINIYLYTVQNSPDLLYFDTSVDAFLVLVIKYYLKRNESESHSVLSGSMWPYGCWPVRLSLSMAFSSRNTGVGCHSLLQGIFLAQGWNPGLLSCRHILYHWNYQGNTRCYCRVSTKPAVVGDKRNRTSINTELHRVMESHPDRHINSVCHTSCAPSLWLNLWVVTFSLRL